MEVIILFVLIKWQKTGEARKMDAKPHKYNK